MEIPLREKYSYKPKVPNHPTELPSLAYSASRSRRRYRVTSALRRAVSIVLVFFLFLYFTDACTLCRRYLGNTPFFRSSSSARIGGVASESSICSKYGGDILKSGGNAADAMVTTVLCVGVVGMYHSGIGGGGHMLVRDPDGSFEFIDFRETAPAAAFQEMYQGNLIGSIDGGLASGVPGELRGLWYLHKKYGSLPWSALVEPAIRTARDGFTVSEDLAQYMDIATATRGDFLTSDPAWAIDFAPNGTRLGLGDTMTRSRYADTLEAISNSGISAFYEGSIAQAMIDAVQLANGTMTLRDLRNYDIVVRSTASVDYRGYRVTSTTAPSNGIITLSILNTLNGYPHFFERESVNLSTHRMDEAIRFGYGERTKLGDPMFVDGMEQYQERLTDAATAQETRRKILDYQTQNTSAYDPDGIESLETHGTSHISTADRSGLAVSLTTTINLLFGSKVIVPETGVIMNNEMDDFSIPGSSNSFGYVPSPANFIRPGKRPLSSITPAIVTRPDGSLYFITGAAGGSRILTATVQSIINVIDQGMSAAEALAQPRLHDQLIPNEALFEYAYNNETVAFMESLGHNVTWVAPGGSSVQAIRVLPDGSFEASGEPRQANSGGVVI